MLKTVSSITNAIGALNYKGTWNASTNSPVLASGVGTKGDYYMVSVAGATNLDGETLWGVGDWAVFNGTAWQRLEGGSTINATTVTANSYNKMAITAPATSSTLAVADGKTLTANNSIALSGTDSTTMTFPTTSATIARTDAAQTFTGVQTFSNAIIPSQTTGITGTTTNNDASAGYVGEYVSSTVASPGTTLTVSGTVYNVTSISLTAGDWDVSGMVFYDSAAGTVLVAYAQSGISTVSATQSATYISFSQTYNSTISSIVVASQLTGTWRVSLSSTTTIYLVARAGWTVQTPFAYGVLRARRVR